MYIYFFCKLFLSHDPEPLLHQGEQLPVLLGGRAGLNCRKGLYLCLSVCMSFCASVCLCAMPRWEIKYLSVWMALCHAGILYASMGEKVYLCLSVCLSSCMSVCLSFCVSACLSLCLSEWGILFKRTFSIRKLVMIWNMNL